MSEVPVYTINPEPQTRARQAIETYVAADSAVRAAMLEAIAAIQEDEPMQAIISLSLSLPIALSLALSLSPYRSLARPDQGLGVTCVVTGVSGLRSHRPPCSAALPSPSTPTHL